ncbi:MAG TPA: universal stress protein [Pseudoxanthomonas sp.]|nr:universal stress protein [Pseudoxanthomonas sp.]
MMYERILIATDGSELAGRGLAHGLALAAALKVPVTVVTVTEPWMPAFDDALALSADPAMQAEYREGCARSAQRILQDALARATTAGVACETVHVADGHPSEAIVAAVAGHGAGLVVMASHGRRGLGRVLLGSQTQAVLAKSTVPVLVVR